MKLGKDGVRERLETMLPADATITMNEGEGLEYTATWQVGRDRWEIHQPWSVFWVTIRRNREEWTIRSRDARTIWDGLDKIEAFLRLLDAIEKVEAGR